MVTTRKPSAKVNNPVKVFSRDILDNGDIACKVHGNHWYTVTIQSNGVVRCVDEHGELCLGHRFNGTCKHIKKVLHLEKLRAEAKQAEEDAKWQREYEAYLHEMGLDQPMTADERRAMHVREFGIYD